jgi:hypothetical protein
MAMVVMATAAAGNMTTAGRFFVGALLQNLDSFIQRLFDTLPDITGKFSLGKC